MNVLNIWKQKIGSILNKRNNQINQNVENYFKNNLPIGTIFYHISNVPPEGAFLLNGQIIYNCSTLYPEFYQYVINNNNIRKITSSTYQSELSSIGICGGFVVDNGAIRLPNICNGFIQGADGSNTGNTINAGLPNITGSFYNTSGTQVRPWLANSVYTDGAIQQAYVTGTGAATQGSNLSLNNGFLFNASNSNAIYGNSNTVQPKSVKCSICIQVFNSASNLSNQVSSQLSSEIQNKLGINAQNLTSAGKNNIIDYTFELDWDNAIDIPSLATFYQANRSGIVSIRATNGNLGAYTSPEIYSGNAGNRPVFGNKTYTTNSAAASTIVMKGDYYIVESDSASVQEMRFYPFKNSIAN